MSTTQPIRNLAEVQKLKNYYLEKGDYRDYLMVTVCLNTALRICDVLSLKWDDVMDENGKKINQHISIQEKKTGKTTSIKMNKSIIKALKLYIKNKGVKSEYLFPNKFGEQMSRTSAYRIVHDGGCCVGLNISCHSLRKTFGYHAWKKGVPPALLMQIYNHSSFEITKRYLGITQDDKDEVYWDVVL